MEKVKSLEEILKEIFKKIHEKREEIKIYLEIIFLLGSIFVLIIATFEKLNFTSFYLIPSEYKELDIYRILQRLVLGFIFLGMYYFSFFMEIDIPIKHFKKIIKFLKRKKIKVKKRRLLIIGIKQMIILSRLLYVGLMGVLLGIFYYFILADSLVHFLPEWILKKSLKLSNSFYEATLYFFLIVNFVLFLLYKFSKKYLKKIFKYCIITVGIILFIYIFKDFFNESEWKRSYELIVNNEKIEVIISKKDGNLIVADGKIINSNGLEVLEINTKKYRIKNFENVTLEYRNFSKVEIANKKREG